MCDDDHQTCAHCILETDAYLPFQHHPPHPFKPNPTPKLRSLYKLPPTIYPHLIHTHLLINFLTPTQPLPQALFIPPLQPQQPIQPIPQNPNKHPYQFTNAP
ncbi:DNA-3-methyladenine glycosylase, partial [Staphylococcus pettenkoferi]|uniref:DNA-3-methyladenine glycosylase n=1 Tax=Staphylococcus pettenkoferi TaxID=170573 RepID=UPI003B97877D